MRRARRMLALGVVAGAVATGCTDDSPPAGSDGSTTVVFESEEAVEAQPVDASSPLAGFETVDEFDSLIGIWVPNGAVGREFRDLQGAYWAFNVRGAPIVEGYDGCNSFGTSYADGDPPMALEDGMLVNVVTSGTLVDCGPRQNDIVPMDGQQFWIDQTGTALAMSPDATEFVFFERAEEQPPRISPEEQERIDREQAELEAQEREREELQQAAQETQVTTAREDLRVGLPVARERWAAAGITSYELRVPVGCLECRSFPDSIGAPHTISVVDDSTDGPWQFAITGGTVDEWFDFLEEWLDDAHMISADFHPDLGYPTDMRFVNRVYSGLNEEPPYEDWLFRDVELTLPDGSNPEVESTASPVELRLDGIGTHDFGDQQSSVVTTLRLALGDPVELEVQAPLVSCIRFGCDGVTAMSWPDAGLVVAFTSRWPDGEQRGEPVLAGWTVAVDSPGWPGAVPIPRPATTDGVPAIRLTTLNGIGLGSTAADVMGAFPTIEFGGYNDSSFVPSGFYLPEAEGRAILHGDVVWDVVSVLQTALNAEGATLAVDGTASPDVLAAFTEYRNRTGQTPMEAFESLGLAAPPDAIVVRLSAGDWFWELGCGSLVRYGIENEC